MYNTVTRHSPFPVILLLIHERGHETTDRCPREGLAEAMRTSPTHCGQDRMKKFAQQSLGEFLEEWRKAPNNDSYTYS